MGREMCFDNELTIKHGIESREKVELSIGLNDNHLSARRLAFSDSDSIGTTISGRSGHLHCCQIGTIGCR